MAALVSFRCPVYAATVTNVFGFSGQEIFPIDQQISNLHVADLDGDGLNDIDRRQQSAFQNQPALQPDRQDEPRRRHVRRASWKSTNCRPDSRFRIDSVPTDERIAALAVTDLNGDGRPDLVYFGDAKDLIVRYNLGTNGWSEPKRWHFDDGRMSPNALATGDLNGDGLDRHRAARRQRRGLFSRAAKRPHAGRAGENPLFRHAQGRADRGCGRRWPE